MKKILILSLAIFCFFSCKSLNSDSETSWGQQKATADQYKKAFKGLAGLYGLFLENICDNHLNVLYKDDNRYSEIRALYHRVEEVRSDYYLKNKDFKSFYENTYHSDINWDGYNDEKVKSDTTRIKSTYIYQELVDKGSYMELKEWKENIDTRIRTPYLNGVDEAKKHFENQKPDIVTSRDQNVKNICSMYQRIAEEGASNYLVEMDYMYHTDLYHAKTNLHRRAWIGYRQGLDNVVVQAFVEHSCDTDTNQQITLTKCSQSTAKNARLEDPFSICAVLAEVALNFKDFKCKKQDLTYTQQTLYDIKATPK